MVEKQSEAFHTFLWHFIPSLKHNFIAYRSSKVSSRLDCLFEIYQLWQSGFSRVYSNCCCSCSFEAEIIKIGQSSHKMYSNNIVNFQESTTILNACTKKSGNLLKAPHTYNFSSMKFRLWGRLQRFIHVNPLSFVPKIIIKDPFFITCNEVHKETVISQPWKKIFCCGYGIFFIFLTKSITNGNAQLTHFLYI